MLLHENVHAIVDALGKDVEKFLHNYADIIRRINYSDDYMKRMYDELRNYYSEEGVSEEFLAYTIQFSDRFPNMRQRILESLDIESRDYLTNKILKKLYGKEERKRARVQMASRFQSTEVQRNNGFDDGFHRGTGAGGEESDQRYAERRLTREGTGAMSDAEVSWAMDPWSRAWGESIRTQKQQREFAIRERRRMNERAKELSERLGVDIEIRQDNSGSIFFVYIVITLIVEGLTYT